MPNYINCDMGAIKYIINTIFCIAGFFVAAAAYGIIKSVYLILAADFISYVDAWNLLAFWGLASSRANNKRDLSARFVVQFVAFN